MPRYDDDDYEPRPPRRSKTSKYYADDSGSDTPKTSRRPRAPYDADPPSPKDKRAPRDYGDPRDVEPRKAPGSGKGSGSDPDRDRKSTRRSTLDDDDYYTKLSSKRDKERPQKKAYDLDDDEIIPPRKNEGRPRRSNTVDLDDTPKRRDSKRDTYDDRRDKRPSRYDDGNDESVVAKPRRSKYDDQERDRGYKSHDDYSRGKSKKFYDSDSDRDVAPRRSATTRRGAYDDYPRATKDRTRDSGRDRDRDRDRGYRSMDEGRRRDKYASRSKYDDRDRDRARSSRYDDDYTDRDRYDYRRGGSSSKRSGGPTNKYGIKLDPETLKTYYETGAKHYQTFKPIINSMAKMYMDSRKAG